MQSVTGRTHAVEQDQGYDSPSGTAGIILAAAEAVMSQKGFAGSSISEIARVANVTDSVIYQYFKDKQDLLFSVPGEKLKRNLVLVHEHLAGIPDVLSQLHKVIWLQLRYHDAHRAYARLLLMECRTFKEFYSSATYESVRAYSRIVASILNRGVKEGRFRSDVPIRLMRDVILGTLDAENISSLAVGEVESAESDFEAVINLVDAMAAAEASEDSSRESRLNTIIRAAKRVFAEKDFATATISDIAGLAGVSDATIYEYFTSKEDILFSAAARQFDSHLGQVADVFEVKDPSRKLQRLIRHHFSSFLSDREFLKVFLLGLQVNGRFYCSQAVEGFKHYSKLIQEIIAEGQAAGVFRPEVDARVFRNMFLGAFSHIAMRWVVLPGSSPVDGMEEIDQVSKLLASAVEFSPSHSGTKLG